MCYGRNHLTNRQRILLCKLKITFIVSWDTHHRPRAIVHQDIVGYPDGYRFSAEWIYCQNPGVESFLDLLDHGISRSPAISRSLLGEFVYISLER